MMIFQILNITNTKFHIEIVGTVGDDPLILQLELTPGKTLTVAKAVHLFRLDGEVQNAFQPIIDSWQQNLVDLNALPPGAPLVGHHAGAAVIHGHATNAQQVLMTNFAAIQFFFSAPNSAKFFSNLPAGAPLVASAIHHPLITGALDSAVLTSGQYTADKVDPNISADKLLCFLHK